MIDSCYVLSDVFAKLCSFSGLGPRQAEEEAQPSPAWETRRP